MTDGRRWRVCRVWKKEWVDPAAANGNTGVKVLKWVRTADSIRFDQEEDHLVGEETMAVMEVEASQPTASSAPALESVTPTVGHMTTVGDAHQVGNETMDVSMAQSSTENTPAAMPTSIDEAGRVVEPEAEGAIEAEAVAQAAPAHSDDTAVTATEVQSITNPITEVEPSVKEVPSVDASQPSAAHSNIPADDRLDQPSTQGSVAEPVQAEEASPSLARPTHGGSEQATA